MNNDKHTPGPWAHRNGRIYQLDRQELTIANVARAFDGDYSPSNGDLLAAAPILLKELIKLRAAHYRSLVLNGTEDEYAELALKSVDDAIAAATGEMVHG